VDAEEKKMEENISKVMRSPWLVSVNEEEDVSEDQSMTKTWIR